MRRLALPRVRRAQNSFAALGTTIRLVIAPASQTATCVALMREWFEAVEVAASRFRADSDLNQLARGERRRPTPLLAALYASAREVEQLTDGLVTPCVRPMLERAGYVSSYQSGDLGQSGEMGSPPGARLDPVARTPWADLDFGGTGKGWAVDRGLERLRSFADGALIDAGGDIGVFGDTRDGGPWHVALAAAPPDRRCIAQLRGGGIATSSVLRRAWTHNDKTAHHLIDPLTGEPASSDVLEATVWARNTLLAEVAAKALVLRGAAFAPRIRSWLPESVCAWTTTTGEFRADSAFREEVLACAV